MKLLDAQRLERLLADDPFARGLILLESTSSTNDEARRLAADGAPEGTVVSAEHQTAGRGRLARSWHSPPGVGLYVSVLFRPPSAVDEVTRWTVASAVAACEACRQAAACEVTVKWPNDLLVRGLKVAGILAEMRSTGGSPSDLVVGTGFNVNHGPEDFPPELRGRAISLRMARGGAPVDRESLASDYVRALGRMSAALVRGEWEPVVSAWMRLAPQAFGRPVRVFPGAPSGEGLPFEGTTRGLDRSGALLVERADGSIATVHLGESVMARES